MKRDSATRILRSKYGIPASDYDKYLTKNGDDYTLNEEAIVKSPPSEPRPVQTEQEKQERKTKRAKSRVEDLVKRSKRGKVVSATETGTVVVEFENGRNFYDGGKKVNKPKERKRALDVEGKSKTIKEAIITLDKFDARNSLASKIRELIKFGKSNEEIILTLNIPDKKKYYPSWYRSQMKRRAAE